LLFYFKIFFYYDSIAGGAEFAKTNRDEVAILENLNSCPFPKSTTSTLDHVTFVNLMKLLLPPLPQRLQTFDDDDALGQPMPHFVAMFNGFFCIHGSTTIYGHHFFLFFLS
jgi:hypothetical protein